MYHKTRDNRYGCRSFTSHQSFGDAHMVLSAPLRRTVHSVLLAYVPVLLKHC